MMRLKWLIPVCAAAALLGGCAVGPDYQRPDAVTGTVYKEASAEASGGADWKPAQPADHLLGGRWWQLFGDVQLDALQQQLEQANQNIRAAEARYRQARAAVREARSAFFPTLTSGAAHTRGNSNNNAVGTNNSFGGSDEISKRNTFALDASWELDVWGRVRRAVEAENASAQASAADLAAARLSAQTELALNYFQLRITEAQQRLYRQTVADYERSLQLTRNQYAVGVAGRAEIVQAEAQLKAAQAQAVAIDIQRAQLEHAVAILLGKAPSELQLEAGDVPVAVPAIPPGLPSDLLERRPDIAAAERQVAAANAEIGVARAAYFPALTLSATGGYQSNTFEKWFSAPNRFWSVGPELALTLFDGGARRAQNERARAAYDETVAVYRQTVLTGLQEVEDNLVALKLLEQERAYQEAAAQAAREALRLVNNQYKAGTVGYLNVLTAETTALTNERSALQVRGEQLTAAVNLIKALGGGWNSEVDLAKK